MSYTLIVFRTEFISDTSPGDLQELKQTPLLPYAIDMEFFVVDWSSHDVSDGECFEISAFGKTDAGLSVCARIAFLPYFFVELPDAWSSARHAAFIVQCVHEHNAAEGYSMLVRRKSIWGFSNGRERTFAQLAFRTDAAFRRARRAIPSRHNLQSYESSVDHIIRLFHVRDIPSSGWISLAAPVKHVAQSERATRCDIEVIASFKDVFPAESSKPPPPLVFASWDLECYSASGKFPVADTPEDVIIGIGTTFQKYGDPDPYKRSYISLGETSDIEGCDVVSCGDEAGMINEWIALLEAEKTDVMIGYNTFGFDYRYVFCRAAVLVDEDTGDNLVDMTRFGRALKGGGEAIEKNLSSSAYGDNNFFFVATPGIFPLDLIQIIRKDHKLSSYSLDAVSQHFLGGDRKLDMKASDIFRKFAHGNADDRADIGKYCVRDTELPLKLMTKLSIFPNTLAMANATRVPLIYLLTRGQQIKVFSVVLRKARQLGYVCPDMDSSSRPADSEYVGATVLDAQRGAYFQPVSALDFASLYPSIMRAHNMCYSTIVLDPAYADLPGIEYYSIDLGNGKTCRFAQNVPSVLPALLEELAQYRKASKKAMAVAKDRGDVFESNVHNGAQLAYKVTSNSVYGFCGASRGFLPLQDIAASVTATGRAMISHTKTLAEKLVPGSRVVYGDSVLPHTPVVVKNSLSEHISIKTIESLAETWEPYEGFKPTETGLEHKEQSKTPFLAWTHQGWAPIKRVIRHKCHKRIYRVLTHTGLVDVTEDHSLLDENVRQIKPNDVHVGTKLLHHDFPTDMVSGTLKEAFLWNDGCQRIDTKNQITAQHYFVLLASMGFNVSIDAPDDIFRVTFTKKKQRRDPRAVKKVHVLYEQYDDYVYDLETEQGVFQAGIGRLIVKNTDSVMVIFNLPTGDMHDHFAVAEKAARDISATFKYPIELEFEKIYNPYLLFSKKRYAGKMYTTPDAHDYIDIKGLQIVRRDNCPLVREVSSKVLDAIMFDSSPERAVTIARDSIVRLLSGKESVDSLVVSKALRADYKNSAQPHVTVASKIASRRGFPVPYGERVPYVFVDDADKRDCLQHLRAEDPAHVVEHGLDVDVLYYLDHQLLQPLKTLLELFVPDVEKEILGHPDVCGMLETIRAKQSAELKTAKRVRKNASNNQREITSFFAIHKT